jgi:hypothetical protein
MGNSLKNPQTKATSIAKNGLSNNTSRQNPPPAVSTKGL